MRYLKVIQLILVSLQSELRPSVVETQSLCCFHVLIIWKFEMKTQNVREAFAAPAYFT